MHPPELSTAPLKPAQTWFMTIAVVLFAAFAIILSLICIYALPDRSVRPVAGSAFFIAGAISIIALLFIIWKKERGILHPRNTDTESSAGVVAPVKEGISEKILKWLATIFALFYSFDSVAIALICIYSLPDETVQPMAGVLYIMGGSIVVGSFVYAIWRR